MAKIKSPEAAQPSSPVQLLGIKQLNTSDFVLVEAVIDGGEVVAFTEMEPRPFPVAVFELKRRAAKLWLPK